MLRCSVLQRYLELNSSRASFTFCLALVASAVCAMSAEDVETGDGLDIKDIFRAWDGDREIRGRLRESSTFLHPKSESRLDNGVCVLNQGVLLPILTRMSLNPERKLPCVSDLRTEMAQCYGINKRGTNPEDSATIIADSWHVRKLLSFVKAKVRREEVSNDLQLQVVNCYSFGIEFCTALFLHSAYGLYRLLLSRTRRSRIFASPWTPACRLGGRTRNLQVPEIEDMLKLGPPRQSQLSNPLTLQSQSPHYSSFITTKPSNDNTRA